MYRSAKVVGIFIVSFWIWLSCCVVLVWFGYFFPQVLKGTIVKKINWSDHLIDFFLNCVYKLLILTNFISEILAVLRFFWYQTFRM